MTGFRKWFLLSFWILLAVHVQGQSEGAAYRSISETFKRDYNTGKYDSIFVHFSPEMQQALPREKTIELFTTLKMQVGNISKMKFIRYLETAALYNTYFERGKFCISLSLDKESRINGLYIKPFIDEVPKPERSSTSLGLPFEEEWFVFWGGDTKEQNYHLNFPAQKNAFDFIIRDSSGKSFRSNGKTNEDYFAFGKKITAPCDGVIVMAVDCIAENQPGEMNPIYAPGNSILLKTQSNEYILLAHFQKNSIQVKEGDSVVRGQLLGLCGNSGNSSEPHLHLHMQNTTDLNTATGIKCYFENISVNGQGKKDYSPIKNETVANL